MKIRIFRFYASHAINRKPTKIVPDTAHNLTGVNPVGVDSGTNNRTIQKVTMTSQSTAVVRRRGGKGLYKSPGKELQKPGRKRKPDRSDPFGRSGAQRTGPHVAHRS